MAKSTSCFSVKLILFTLCLSAGRSVAASLEAQAEWTRQLSSEVDAFGHGVAMSRLGVVYVTGDVDNRFLSPVRGSWDAFLSKYDSFGVLQWSTLLDSGADDSSSSIAIDNYENIYISGFTRGDLGGSNVGFRDAFINKYNSAGDLLWSRQLESYLVTCAHAARII